METLEKLKNASASFRLVGVLTIGITQLPLASFGYPEDWDPTGETCNTLTELIKTHPYSRMIIEIREPRLDRISWQIYSEDPATTQTQPVVELFLDLPMETRTEIIGSRLFAQGARKEKEFLVAITLQDQTLLAFYALSSFIADSKTGMISTMTGTLNHSITGESVPLLRSIERLKSQIAPQRRVELLDEDLGIIYHFVAGTLE